MAERSASREAIILRSKEVPSGARVVTLLSPVDGLTDAFVFGGGKSKLRSLASPWHLGTAWTYRDPAKDFIKLTDFDPIREFPSIRKNLGAIGAASFFSEFMSATSALGGDWEDAFALSADALGAADSAAEASDAAALVRVVVLFAVRALESLGVMPDPGECAECGRQFEGGAPKDASRRAGASTTFGLHWYSRRHGGFVCPSCARDADGSETLGGLVEIPPGALAWLEACGRKPFAAAAAIMLERESLDGLKATVLDLASKVAGAPLKTLESGFV